MLAAFIILMAAKSPSNDSSKLSLGGHQQALSDHGEQPRAQQPKALRKKAARAARVARPVKPRPTHFLSVRINNPTIWRKVIFRSLEIVHLRVRALLSHAACLSIQRLRYQVTRISPQEKVSPAFEHIDSSTLWADTSQCKTMMSN